MEQFGHNRAYTFEMDRACFSTECFRQGVYAYKCVGIVIHLGRFRAEDQVCSQAFAEFAVTLKVSRVGFQVLGRTELCRIYKITYNTCLDKLKKNKKDNNVVYIEDFKEHQVNAIQNIIESIDEKERNQKIQECLQLLPSEEAFLLTLYYFDDQSTEEIAKVIDCNANNVKIKLYRTRKKLASILKEQLEPEILSYYESKRR